MQAPDLPAALIPITHQLRAYFQETYPDRLDQSVMLGSWTQDAVSAEPTPGAID